MISSLSRRTFLAGASGLGLAALAGCSAPASTPQASAGPATIQFSYWGPDFYQRFTQQMIDAFGADQSAVTVAAQPSEWSSYWDKLATMTAANTPPDVINMDGKYLAEYAGRGVLADLTQVEGLDLSSLSDEDRQAGTFKGKLYAASTGSNAFALFANPAVFQAAGVPIPDDATWTWDNYLSSAQAITKGATDGSVGATGGGTYADLTIFLRQRGQDLFSADGVGYTDDTLAQWFELQKTIMTSGAGFTSASKTQEDGAAPYEQQAFSTGKAGMFWSWTNQLANARKATGQEIVMLRPPSLTGKAQDNGLFFKASMYWSIAARSSYLKAAGTFVNFLLNSPKAAEIQLLNRGVPSSQAALAAMGSNLTATDTYIVEWLNKAKGDMTLPAPTVQPQGTADSQNSIARALQEVRFDRQTPASAAKQLTAEITSMIK